jgi:hypothetical protein
VFLSHTSELRQYSVGGSFVAAAEQAVARAGDAVMDMAYFHCPRHRPRRSMFETRVAGADVVVVIAGCGTASPSVISPRCPTPSWSIAPPRSRHFHPGLRARRRRARSGGDVPRYGARARRDAFRARLADSGVATRRSPPQRPTSPVAAGAARALPWVFRPRLTELYGRPYDSLLLRRMP